MRINIPSLSLKKFLKKEIGDSEKILDIGCGDGLLSLFLTSSLNCHIYGIDLDKDEIYKANKKFKKHQTKGLASYYICDAGNIDKKFHKNTFDIILIIHTLHHLIEVGNILSKARYVLKPNGKIFICEYKCEYGEKFDNCPRYSPKKIVSMLNTACFRNIKIHNIHRNLIMIAAQKNKRQL